MSIIQENQESNDPRELDQDPPVPKLAADAGSVEQLPAVNPNPPEIPGVEPGTVVNELTGQEELVTPPEVLQEQVTGQALTVPELNKEPKPIPVETSPAQETPNVTSTATDPFPTTTAIMSQYQQAEVDRYGQLLDAYSDSFNTSFQTGRLQPFLYETGLSKTDDERLSNSGTQAAISTALDALNDLSLRQLQQPNPTPFFKLPEINENRDDPSKPSLNSRTRVRNHVLGLGFHGLAGAGREVEDAFKPLQGLRNWFNRLRQEPGKAAIAAISSLAGNPMAFPAWVLEGGKYGEYGDGVLGATFYLLDNTFGLNPIKGAAVDVHNVITGNEQAEGDTPNWLQALGGKDYAFTQFQDPEGSDRNRPFSTINPSTEFPQDVRELRQRSWIHRINPLILGASAPELLGFKPLPIPEWIPNAINSVPIPMVEKKNRAGRVLQAGEAFNSFVFENVTEGFASSAIQGLTKLGMRGTQAVQNTEIMEQLGLPPAAQRLLRSAADDLADDAVSTPRLPTSQDLYKTPRIGQIEDTVNQVVTPVEVVPTGVILSVDDARLSGVDITQSTFTDIDVNNLPDIIEPDAGNLVRRSNTELTNLASDLNIIRPQPKPLSSREIGFYNEISGGALARYGRQLPEELAFSRSGLVSGDDLQTLFERAENLAVSRTVNVPMNTADTVTYQNRLLPEGLRIRTPVGIEATQEYLRAQQVFTSLADELSDVNLRYRTEVESLANNLTKIEKLLDVGRQDLLPSDEIAEILNYVPETNTDALQGLFKQADDILPSRADNLATVENNLIIENVNSDDFTWTRSPLTDNDDYQQVGISVAELDEAWKRGGTDLYIDQSGSNAIGNRLQNAREFLSTAKASNMPEVSVNPDRSVTFVDGRHRFVALRDAGVTNIPVVMKNSENWSNIYKPVDDLKLPSDNYDDLLLGADDDVDTVFQGLSMEINQRDIYFHGTKAQNLDIASIDPVLGASRSEIGTGIHFTTSKNLADGYANASPGRNVPFGVARQYSDAGQVHSARFFIKNPIDATNSLEEPVKQVLTQAVTDSMLAPNVRKAIKAKLKKELDLPEFYRFVDEKIAEEMSGSLMEATSLQFQRQVNVALQDAGYDAVYYSPEKFKGMVGGDYQVMLLNPAKANYQSLSVEQLAPLNRLQQNINRYNVDSEASRIFPKSTFAQVNKAESAIEVQSQAAFTTAKLQDDLKQKLDAVAGDINYQEARLKMIAEEERIKTWGRKLKRWDAQNETKLQHFSTPENGIC